MSIGTEDPLVRELVGPWLDALHSGNVDAVAESYDDPFLLLATLRNEPCRDTADLKAYFSQLIARKATVDLEEAEAFSNAEIATASGIYVFTFDPGTSAEERVRARFTFIGRRREQGWKIAVHHSSMTPYPDMRSGTPELAQETS